MPPYPTEQEQAALWRLVDAFRYRVQREHGVRMTQSEALGCLVDFEPAEVPARTLEAIRLLLVRAAYTPRAVDGVLAHVRQFATLTGCEWLEPEDLPAVQRLMPGPVRGPEVGDPDGCGCSQCRLESLERECLGEDLVGVSFDQA